MSKTEQEMSQPKSPTPQAEIEEIKISLYAKCPHCPKYVHLTCDMPIHWLYENEQRMKSFFCKECKNEFDAKINL